jgi:chromosome segregation ATPase
MSLKVILILYICTQMERDNPDPELLCPVVELGIHALKRRYEHQNMESKVLQSYVTEMNDSLKLIETSISKIDIRFSGLKSKQSILYNRLLAILSKIEVLRNRNVPLSENEIRLYRRIQQMMQELQVPHNKLLALMNTQVTYLTTYLTDCQQVNDPYSDFM